MEDWSSSPRETAATTFVLFHPCAPLRPASLMRMLRLGREPPAARATWMLRAQRRLGTRLAAVGLRGRWRARAASRSLIVELLTDDVDLAAAELVDDVCEQGLAIWNERDEELAIPVHADAASAAITDATAWVASRSDACLICEGGPDYAYYVQLFGLESPGLAQLEAVAGPHLPAELALSAYALRRLALLGLAATPEAAPNLACVVDVASPEARSRAAQRVLAILTSVYGFDQGDLLRLRLSGAAPALHPDEG